VTLAADVRSLRFWEWRIAMRQNCHRSMCHHMPLAHAYVSIATA
jgi:hypothetical protein